MIRHLFAAAIVLAAAPAVHAGIALQTYTPGTTDYTATASTLSGTMISGEGGSFPSTVGKWFTFTMPHAGRFTSITFPMTVTSRTNASATLNIGFWLGNDPASSTVGGVTLPAADIVVGQTKEYTINFPAGYQYGAGQNVTLDFDVVGLSGAGATFNANLFLSNTAGTTHQRGLGVIFGPTQAALPAIVVTDDTAPVPEPASLSVLAAGSLLMLKRRRP